MIKIRFMLAWQKVSRMFHKSINILLVKLLNLNEYFFIFTYNKKYHYVVTIMKSFLWQTVYLDKNYNF